MANLINLEQVSKTYGLKTLLDGVSLGVQSGDRIGIVGVNGGGKTTLLEVLTGIEPPDVGRVSHTSDLRMAVVTQRFDLPDELTIAQVIIEPLELETYEWASNAKVRDVLGGLGIVDLGLDTPVGSLSGGERRRVALAKLLLLAFVETIENRQASAYLRPVGRVDRVAFEGATTAPGLEGPHACGLGRTMPSP